MIRTQISVDAELFAKAKDVAQRMGISLAELCRRSLEQAVARHPNDKPWMAYAGAIEGHPNDTVTVDDVVYGRAEP